MDQNMQSTPSDISSRIKSLTDEAREANKRFDESSGKLAEEIIVGLDEFGKDLDKTDKELEKQEAEVSAQFDEATANYLSEVEKESE